MSGILTAYPLQLKVQRKFGAFTLDCELAFELGDILALFGPSGCGKSTLLRIIAGLDRGLGELLPEVVGQPAHALSGGPRQRVALGQQILLARITNRSARRLPLAPNQQIYAYIKVMSLVSEG